MVPQFTVAVEHYNRLIRMIQQGEKLKMTVDLQVEYQDQDNMATTLSPRFGVRILKDEIVMLGGHNGTPGKLGTGATDNGRGCRSCDGSSAHHSSAGIKTLAGRFEWRCGPEKRKDYLGPGLYVAQTLRQA